MIKNSRLIVSQLSANGILFLATLWLATQPTFANVFSKGIADAPFVNIELSFFLISNCISFLPFFRLSCSFPLLGVSQLRHLLARQVAMLSNAVPAKTS